MPFSEAIRHFFRDGPEDTAALRPTDKNIGVILSKIFKKAIAKR